MFAICADDAIVVVARDAWHVVRTSAVRMQPDWLSRRVTLLEQRVDRLEARFDELTTHMDARFAQVDARFAQVDARFDAVDARFDSVEQVLISLQTQITSNHRESSQRFDELGRHMRALHEDLIDRISKIKG